MAARVRNKSIRSLGKAIKQRIPLATIIRLRYAWWLFYACLLRRLWAKKAAPRVHSFGGGQSAQSLVSEIEAVNLSAPTAMCRVMSRYGSDKGCFHHNYTVIYDRLFKSLRNEPLRIFELGLGTHAADLESSMGVTGSLGASLRGWRELFPHALVYGADIDRNILFTEERIKTFYCDQLDAAAIGELWAHPELKDGVDILIEDGLHTPEANLSFLDGSLEHVRPGGYYIVEGIKSRFAGDWLRILESNYARGYPDYEFVFAGLPNRFNAGDNNLLIVHRSG